MSDPRPSHSVPHFAPPSRSWPRRQRAYSWMKNASCLGHEDIWDSEEPGDVEVARGYCAACPVRVQCAEMCWSDESSARHGGTWAGKTAAERRAIAAYIAAVAPPGIEFSANKISGPVDWAIMLTLDVGAEEASA